MKRYLSLFLCTILSSSLVQAQWTEWIDSGLVVHLNTDSVPISHLLSVKKQYDTIYACGETANDPYHFTNVVKLNEQLQIISSKSYQGKINLANTDSYYSLAPAFFLPDGIVVFSGVFFDYDTVPGSIYQVPLILLLNPDNTIAWTKSISTECDWYGSPLFVTVFENKILTSKNYYCGGKYGNVLSCIDLNGNLKWSRELGSNNPGTAVKILPLIDLYF